MSRHDKPDYAAARLKVVRFQGPFAKVFSCPFCRFHVTVKKPVGNMLVASGAATAKVAAHIRADHADKVS